MFILCEVSGYASVIDLGVVTSSVRSTLQNKEFQNAHFYLYSLQSFGKIVED